MFTVIITVLIVCLGFMLPKMANPRDKKFFNYGSYASYGLAALILVLNSYTIVPTGHVKVPVLFGKVQDIPLTEGLKFPVNPLLDFELVDGRDKTHKERAGVPSEDKLITTVDVSVQYRIIKGNAPDMLRNTGDAETTIQVHMIPKLRSILREQGKGVKMAQDFFKESVQVKLQESLQVGLSEFLAPKGIQVDNVLIRGVTLPKVIQNAITETKKREQEVVKQAAELERFAMEQEQKVRQAESELSAAILTAQKIKALADAEAYKIKKMNEQLSKSGNYIELKKAERWDGKLPVYSGGDNTPMIDLR